MKILQLCMFTNLWGKGFEVESWDIINGKDILDLAPGSVKNYDLILCAPPCTQFTKANQHNWVEYPEHDVMIAKHCLDLCEKSNSKFVIENPPGRIEKLVPGLKRYRVLTLNDKLTNKEWVLYSNMILLASPSKRYGKKSISNLTKYNRLAYPQFFIDFLKQQLTN